MSGWDQSGDHDDLQRHLGNEPEVDHMPLTTDWDELADWLGRNIEAAKAAAAVLALFSAGVILLALGVL